MIFYTQDEQLNFGEGSPEFHLQVARVILGLVLVVCLLAASLMAKRMGWADGASVLLHLGEVATAGVLGIILGERNAIRETKRTAAKKRPSASPK